MADLQKMLEEVKSMTILELNEFVKMLETEFGVSAAAMAVAAPGAGAGVAAAAPEVEEKTDFDVVLKEIGANKISVIKVCREITGLGLAEAKALVDKAPGTIKEAVPKAAAEEMVAKFKEAGAVAELK